MVWRSPSLALAAGLLCSTTTTTIEGAALFQKGGAAFIHTAPCAGETSLRPLPHCRPQATTTMSSGLFPLRQRRWSSSSALKAATYSVYGEEPQPGWWEFWKKTRAAPPASKSDVLKNLLTKQKPVYGGLDHTEDYMSACRFLGVPLEVDEVELEQKVLTLKDKYKGDRKKQIQINWNYDIILEHRIFLALDGKDQITEEVLEAEPNIYRELNEGAQDLQDADLTKVKNILGMGYGAVASSGSPAWLKNAKRSPLSRLIQPSFWLGLFAFIKLVLVESIQTPKPKFFMFPAGLSYVANIYWLRTLLENPSWAYPAIIISHVPWIYLRGISPQPGLPPGQLQPIKWRRVAASFICATAAAFGGYLFSTAWYLLGFPIGDIPLEAFTLFMVSTWTWVGGGGFFIRDSILGYLVSRKSSSD